MTAFIKKMYGEDVDPEIVDGMMQAADLDNDGQIDMDEFKTIMRSGPKSKKGTDRVSVSDATLSWQAGFKDVDKSDEGLEKAFKLCDKDNTGFMDPEELTAYIGKVYGVRLAPTILDEMMAEADGNADGQVDVEEFKLIMRKGPNRPPRAGLTDNLPSLDDLNPFKGFKSVFGGVDLSDKGLEDAFKSLDTDGSGRCSDAELEAYIRQVHKKKLGPEAIATMMAEADTDKDGEVDLEEFKLIMRGAPKAEKEQAAKAAKKMFGFGGGGTGEDDDPIAYATNKAKDEAIAAGKPPKEVEAIGVAAG
jgi:Ca2+-binding EF-hand superfamily protein